MARFIAFLRAVNVGGRIVKMEQLRTIFETLGFANVETFIASGNVIFESTTKNTVALERKIEAQLQRSLGYTMATFIRTDTEIAAIVDYKPFKAPALKSALTFNVAFLAEPLTPDAVKALMRLKTEIDDFHVNGREMYWLCKKKQNESTFSNALFERTLKISATFRGINTVRKLTEKYAPNADAPASRKSRRRD